MAGTRVNNCLYIVKHVLLLCALSLLLFSCEDNITIFESSSNQISFLVTTSSEWRDARSSQSRIYDDGGVDMNVTEGVCKSFDTPLYLHTLTTRWTEKEAICNKISNSRGTIISDLSEYDSFRLYAFAYENEIEDIMNPNFINDDRVTKSGDTWTSGRFWPSNKCKVRFFGIAPYENENIGIDFPNITYKVPTSYIDQKDILVCNSTTVDVNPPMEHIPQPLTMKHALTSIKFAIDEGEDEYGNARQFEEGIIRSVVLKNIYDQDTYNLYSEKWNQNYESLVSFPLYNADCLTTESSDIMRGNEAFLMIPQVLNEKAEAEIEFTDNKTGLTHTFNVKLGKEWVAGTKVTYYLSTNKEMINHVFKLVDVENNKQYFPNEFENFFTANYEGLNKNFLIHSYAEITTTTSKSVRPVPIELDTTKIESWVHFLPNETVSGHDKNKGCYGYTLIVNELEGVSDESLDQHEDALQKETVSGCYNLSNPKYPNNYDISDKYCNTANCYLIKAAGRYCFPIVYGNAIKDGTPNLNAYHTDKTTSKNGVAGYTIIQNLPSHLGSITTPRIQDNTYLIGSTNYSIVPSDAQIIWMDKPNLVSDIRLVQKAADKTWYIESQVSDLG